VITVNVPQDVREEVLFPLGYPFLTEEDFNELLPQYTQSIDMIQRYIDKAIRQYNIVNPPIKKTTQPVNGEFSIDYPENCYGVVNTRIITIKGRGVLGPNQVPNTFSNLNMMTNSAMMAGSGGNAFGTPYNFGMDTSNYLLNKARTQGLRDASKTLVIDNDIVGRVLNGYSNMGGDLRITWIKNITVWEEVPFSHRDDVISLASAHLLKWLGNLIEKEDVGDLPVDVDGQAMIDDGKALETKIEEKWAKFPQITTA